MASVKHSRYSSFDSRSSTSSQISDPSSSSELKKFSKNQSSLKRFIGSSSTRRRSPDPVAMTDNSSRALVKVKSAGIDQSKIKNEQNLSSMMKKFMEKRSKPKASAEKMALVIPADFIAEDLKKTAVKGSNFSSLHRKLFQKGSSKDQTKVLTEVKPNTRTLAMVLRSERELLNENKELETEISELNLTLEEKNREVEKLRDLCVKQREEIKTLKSAILFPDFMNSHLQELLEKQGSELNQAKLVIPTLQRQVTSLTGQLQCLASDLAEVKADKNAVNTYFKDYISSPRTPTFDQDAADSLEYSYGDTTTPGSSDDIFLMDFNPCLTPYSAKSKSMEFNEMLGYDSPHEEGSSRISRKVHQENFSSSHGRRMSKSSDYCQRPSQQSAAAFASRRLTDSSSPLNLL